MTHKKQKEIIVSILYTTIVILLVYIVLKYAVKLFAPFLFGYAIAYFITPISRYITHHSKINHKIAAVFTGFLFYTIIFISIWLLCWFAFINLMPFIKNFPNLYQESIYPFLLHTNGQIVTMIEKLSPQTAGAISEVFSYFTQAIGAVIAQISEHLLSGAFSISKKIPMVSIGVFFTMISSILICVDYKNVTDFIIRQIPPEKLADTIDVKCFLFNSIARLGKAYIIIMAITFLELSFGFLLLKVNYAISIAMIVSLLDILPLIGSGIVLVPWGVIVIVSGNIPLGIGILILYALTILVRNIIEPKIIGDQIGLHPVVAILCIFIGLNLFGVLGIFLLPLIAITIKYLKEKKNIRFYQ